MTVEDSELVVIKKLVGHDLSFMMWHIILLEDGHTVDIKEWTRSTTALR